MNEAWEIARTIQPAYKLWLQRYQLEHTPERAREYVRALMSPEGTGYVMMDNIAEHLHG